ncbi:hypothetical protein ICN84_06230 [Akkermansia glycaniphila]|uniref:hypothetical protein n=1 Tax=Akkermansia glycaniphila TaxID=1679444 RepID=UPI001C01176E|nr:hypothetical protein [Akkermansia glycaniphila]MBT9449673.1 hypothetical protein [Akkermansia glycaniphila]
MNDDGCLHAHAIASTEGIGMLFHEFVMAALFVGIQCLRCLLRDAFRFFGGCADAILKCSTQFFTLVPIVCGNIVGCCINLLKQRNDNRCLGFKDGFFLFRLRRTHGLQIIGDPFFGVPDFFRNGIGACTIFHALKVFEELFHGLLYLFVLIFIVLRGNGAGRDADDTYGRWDDLHSD